MELDQLVGFTSLIFLAFVPYVFASQGTMLSGRTGQFNVAQEGIMLSGASVGFLAAEASGSLAIGVLAAMLVGGLFGLAFAFLTTTLNMNQFVVGLALFFMGTAFSTLAFKLTVGITLTLPMIPTLKKIPLPWLSKIPVLGEILFNQNIFVYFSYLLSAFLYYFLYKTSYGLQLRSVGENPKAADSLGINVTKIRYLTAIGGGMLMGIAGVYLPMVYTGTFTEGITRGRGWLSIALTFFGGWRPHTIFVGALFFSAVEVAALRMQILGTGIPHQVLLTLPYLITLIIMTFGSRWVRIPGFLGKNYDREKRSVG